MFWVNIVLMILVVVAIPVAALYMLDTFTHHGEKIEVPNVVGNSLENAENMLQERGLVAVVADSTYSKRMAPGAVLEQSPKAGLEVKGGRVIYLTVNQRGVPMVQMPDVVGQGSLRQAVAVLESLGFKLTQHETVVGMPKDLVIAVKQGRHKVQAGQMVPRDQKLTIVIGGGEIDSTMFEEEEDSVIGNDFDIEL